MLTCMFWQPLDAASQLINQIPHYIGIEGMAKVVRNICFSKVSGWFSPACDTFIHDGYRCSASFAAFSGRAVQLSRPPRNECEVFTAIDELPLEQWYINSADWNVPTLTYMLSETAVVYSLCICDLLQIAKF